MFFPPLSFTIYHSPVGPTAPLSAKVQKKNRRRTNHAYYLQAQDPGLRPSTRPNIRPILYLTLTRTKKKRVELKLKKNNGKMSIIVPRPRLIFLLGGRKTNVNASSLLTDPLQRMLKEHCRP